MIERLGIFGGTFDPIHFGHLFLAEEARIRFGLDRVLLIPNGRPPHKDGLARASGNHRFEMTRLAAAGNPAFECSRVELERPGMSYTIDTLALLREQNPSADLLYITGVDTAAELMTWRRPGEVVQLARIVAATRPGYDAQTLLRRLPDAIRERVSLLETTALDISSTDIRQRVQHGEAVRYLTPDSVLEYIEGHGLYLPEAGSGEISGDKE